MQGRPIDFHFHEFRLDYEQTKHLAVGKAVYSDPFSAGGHMWKIKCFPRGNWSSDSDEHLSVFVELENQPRLSVSAIFEVFLMDKDGQRATIFNCSSKDRGSSVPNGRLGLVSVCHRLS
jgi:speckle-type POZ protein